MYSWRAHSAWLLLVLFMLGGVATPAVHQVQHDESHTRATVVPDDRTPHSEIDHTMRSDADPDGTHAFYCLLCHTQIVSAFGQQVATTAPPLQATALSTTSSFVWSLSRLGPSPIRGPPATA
jgi:hypothetical protein